MKGSLPQDTVTLLFTDIEGSTELLRRTGDDYARLLETHRVLLRTAFQAHEGHEIGTEGDSFFVAFPSALMAVTACIAAQRALHQHHWPAEARPRVRMGLHTGQPKFVDNSYIGLDVHHAARIANAAHGDQILLSPATLTIVESQLPGDITVRALGEYWLKDFPQPLHLSQLENADLPHQFPPLRARGSRHHNLPVPTTSFIGRAELVEAAITLLESGTRLLTLTGPGGTGKTRLSLQIAERMRFSGTNSSADGIFFVALAPINDGRFLAAAIASGLGVKETVGQSADDAVQEFLREKQLLLILDNFEQIVTAAPFVSQLLGANSRLQVLASSRVPLRIVGEREFAVPPLALPTPSSTTATALSQFASVHLFIERAQLVRPDFAISEENASAVAEICARLDGLPLAIELAAARIKMLSPQAMLARFEKTPHAALQLLTGGARDADTRQQTLRAAIAWSYDLLTQNQKAVFRTLCVFVDGCDWEAAEAVCNHLVEEDEVFDTVSFLVDHNLLVARESNAGEPRFFLLETIREFGLEQLEQVGEELATRRAHLDYFSARAEHLATQIMGPQQLAWLEWGERELSNIRAALEWSWKHDVGAAGRLSRDFSSFWQFAHTNLGRSLLARTIQISEGMPVALQAELWDKVALLAARQSDYVELEAAALKTLALAQDAGEAGRISAIWAWTHLLHTPHFRHDPHREIAILYEIMDEARVLNYLPAIAQIPLLLMWRLSDREEQAALLREAIDAAHKMGDIAGQAANQGILAETYGLMGDYVRARALLNQSLVLSDSPYFHHKDVRGWLFYRLGRLEMVEKNYVAAHAAFCQSLMLFREVHRNAQVAADDQTYVSLSHSLAALGWHAATQDQWQRSATLLGARHRQHTASGHLPAADWENEINWSIERIKEALGDDEFFAAWAQGEAMNWLQATAYALEESGPHR